LGLHASASAALVIEVLRSAITNYGPPEEVLTDNGPQYVTWRGPSAFGKELEARGVRQVVASPRRPQTLGKVERLWGTLWREWLAGLRTPAQAAALVNVSLPRYYQLETRAVAGLVRACEPQPKGRRRGPLNELAALTKENERLRRDLGRQQSLVRLAQRSVGLSPPPPAVKGLPPIGFPPSVRTPDKGP
jgi:transposase InsO family protein